jgi:hypothetical protein
MLLRCLPEDRVLVSTEHDAFCLEQLQQNIPSEMREGFTLTDSIEIGDRRQNFGLVVSDGKIGKSANCDYLVKGAVCFVEGNRARVRESILRRLTTRGLSCDFE